MKHFLRENGFLVLLIAALLAALSMVFSYAFTGNANPIANVLGLISTPARNAGASVGDWIEGLYSGSFERDAMLEEIERLRGELADMERQAREGEAATRENERLRILLGLREARQDFDFESATVTARATSNWESSFTVSKGSVHGVAKDQCVVDAFGHLLGVVDEVGYNWATVLTVVDAGIEMGGLIARTDSAAILEGDFELMLQGRLKLTYLPESTELIAGDTVLTSGRGGVYPAGIVVGTIESMHTDPSGMTRYAVVAPKGTYAEERQVFIIKEFDIVE